MPGREPFHVKVVIKRTCREIKTSRERKKQQANIGKVDGKISPGAKKMRLPTAGAPTTPVRWGGEETTGTRLTTSTAWAARVRRNTAWG